MLAIPLLLAATFAGHIDGKFMVPSFKFNVRGAVASVIAATTFQSALMPTSPSFLVPSVNAAVNPLADVGLKEFLVKDGRQFLRLAVPVGKSEICILSALTS